MNAGGRAGVESSRSAVEGSSGSRAEELDSSMEEDEVSGTGILDKIGENGRNLLIELSGKGKR